LSSTVCENLNKTVDEHIQYINDLMMHKVSLLYEIYKFTLDEFGYIKEENMEQMGCIIEQKQDLIHEVDYLDRKFLAEYMALKERLGISSLDEIEPQSSKRLTELRLNTFEIMEILFKIDELDKKVNRRMSKMRDGIAMELIKIRKQKHIHSIYSNEKPREKNQSARAVASGAFHSSFDKKH